ncbi:sigma-54-dependent Fis family transcriptional regulator, partial [bacterium]|nr:sigma-54-dependent Fis family transcriptional regulator [bacterium]
MTGYSSIETAISAIRLGAKDYLLKPFEIDEFKSAVQRAIDDTSVPTKGDENFPIIVGISASMKQILEMIEKVAPTESTVLLQGESGTGKELIARALHLKSERANKPFIPVNCSTISESLFESEMFGHSKGSFTGAINDKSGLFTEANAGTIFLDEIGDLALPNQAKLLRVLQDGSFKRVGDVK